jgi:nondiscriminating aspartyl-tRNA synthetase
MERTLALESIKKIGEKVTLEGWVITRRDHGKIVFIDLWDRSALIQVVVKEVSEGDLEKIKPQAAVRVSGTVQKRSQETVNPKIQTGSYEVVTSDIQVLAEAASLPFDIETDLQIETFLDHAPLTLRSKKAKAIFKVQAEIVQAWREFLNGAGFTEIHTPKIVATATEGGANLFEIAYFDRKAYLAQSPQFYKQMMVPVFERVYEVGPVFRAEPHSTTRHINEYVSLDMEMGFIEGPEDVIEVGNSFIKFLINKLEPLKYEFGLFEAAPPSATEIPTLSLREAQEILKKEFNRDVVGDPDFEPNDEKLLGEYVKNKWKSDFVWVTGYPTKKRPFYTMPDPKNKEVSRGFDLIFRGMEIITGGQRINDHQMLVEAIKSRGLNPSDFAYYLEAFQYGMPPEGGFALGLERLTAKLLGIENIRLATLFPRDLQRLTP